MQQGLFLPQLSYVEMPNGLELIFEYIAAFIFGWFILQAGMMRSMYKNYLEAHKKTFFAETLSMNFFIIGMIPLMLILMHQLPFGRNPAHISFWFSMGMVTLLVGLNAFPINYCLVKPKLQHGCITLSEKPSHSDK